MCLTKLYEKGEKRTLLKTFWYSNKIKLKKLRVLNLAEANKLVLIV